MTIDFPAFELHSAAIFALFLTCVCAGAQSGSGFLEKADQSSTLTFITKDGACVRGTVSRSAPDSVTVQPFKQQSVALRRDALLQVAQGNALLFSARSSWLDVVNAHLYPREYLVVVTKNKKQIKGTVVTAGNDGVTVKHGLTTSVISKADIATVDYLRWKPATDGFNLALEEAPWALVFYPEFYGRVAGIEGRVAVRLYDARKPEDDTTISQKPCFP